MDLPIAALCVPDVIFSAPGKDDAPSGGQPMGGFFEQTLLIFDDAVIAQLGADPVQMRRNHADLE